MNLVSMPVSHLATVQSGGGAPQHAAAFTRTGFPFVRAGSLPKLLDGAEEGSLELIEPKVADEYGLKLFPAGTVLFAKSGMSATKGHVYRLRKPAYVVNHLAALVPREGSDSAFLAHALQRYSPIKLIKDPAYPSIRLGDIESMRIHAPTSPRDREHIADILDKADALRAKRRAALAKLDDLVQSIFLDMFGDPATNPKGWPVEKLRSLGQVITGTTPPSARAGMFDGPVPFVTPGDLESSQPVKRTVTEEGATASRTVNAGATLVCCIGATIGKMSNVSVRGAFNQQINAVQWGQDVEPNYGLICMRFLKPKIVAWGASTTLPILKKSTFEQIEIPVPPYAQQRTFARLTENVQQLEADHKSSLRGAETLFASLQHRAFRGEL